MITIVIALSCCLWLCFVIEVFKDIQLMDLSSLHFSMSITQSDLWTDHLGQGLVSETSVFRWVKGKMCHTS